MFDTAAARRMMVDCQVRTADVTNPDLIAAMLDVPRELFVPSAQAKLAYLDSDIAIGGGRVLLKLIQDERAGKFEGDDVQIIPHLTGAIQDWIVKAGEGIEYLQGDRLGIGPVTGVVGGLAATGLSARHLDRTPRVFEQFNGRKAHGRPEHPDTADNS